MTRHPLIALFLALLPLPAVAGDEGAVETWARVHIAGAPAGWAHSTVRRVDGQEPRVESVLRTEIRMKRMGQAAEIATTSETWETPGGALLRVVSTTRMSAQESRTVFTFAGGKVTVETTVMGKTRSVEKDVPADLVGPAHAEGLTRTLAGTTGKTIEFTTFMADLQSAVRTTLTSRGPETVKLHDGSSSGLTRVETRMALAKGGPLPMSPVSWLDAGGAPVRTEVTVAGLRIETFRVADEKAARAQEAGKPESPDLFAETIIPEDGLLPVPRRIEEAVITVRKRRPDVNLPDFGDAGHAVTRGEDGSLVIRASRRTPAPGREGTRPLENPAPELADALAPSSMIQSDAPEIAAVAKEVAGGERSAWKAARALERWVWKGISKKSMNVASASALEVFRTREGDCTEHAVLLAALCRAAGIPARVLMGIEYLAGIWGGHAWNEVWVEGEWYPLDATNGMGFVDPLHLPVVRMTMKEGGGAEMVELIGVIGGIDVDVTEVVRDGKRIAVDDPALAAVEDGVYRDRLHGVTFRAPPGFAFEPADTGRGIRAKVAGLEGKTAGGKPVRIGVSVLDAPAEGDAGRELGLQPVPPDDPMAGRKVDGRPAFTASRERDGVKGLLVAVEADGALWLFTLDPAGGEGERAAFDAFLAGVDFDLKPVRPTPEPAPSPPGDRGNAGGGAAGESKPAGGTCTFDVIEYPLGKVVDPYVRRAAGDVEIEVTPGAAERRVTLKVRAMPWRMALDELAGQVFCAVVESGGRLRVEEIRASADPVAGTCTFDAVQQPVEEALVLVQEAAGKVAIRVAPEVRGRKVTLRVRGAAWRQVLDRIAADCGAAVEGQGDGLLVAIPPQRIVEALAVECARCLLEGNAHRQAQQDRNFLGMAASKRNLLNGVETLEGRLRDLGEERTWSWSEDLRKELRDKVLEPLKRLKREFADLLAEKR